MYLVSFDREFNSESGHVVPTWLVGQEVTPSSDLAQLEFLIG